MSKKEFETPAARAARLHHTRAELAGPALYAALKPVVERATATPTWQHRDGRRRFNDTVAIVLTVSEIKAMAAAVGRVEEYEAHMAKLAQGEKADG